MDAAAAAHLTRKHRNIRQELCVVHHFLDTQGTTAIRLGGGVAHLLAAAVG